MEKDRKNQLKLLIVLILVLATMLFFIFFYKIKSSVCINEVCFNVQVPKTSEEFTRGLMHVEILDEDKGMLFIFPLTGNYSFWMKNTLIPLDIIWIDEDYHIVFIKNNALPCNPQENCPTINPGIEAKYVLEINSGLSDKYGFEIGDKIRLNL